MKISRDFDYIIDKSSQPSCAHIQGKAMPGTHYVCRLFAPWLSIFMLQEIMTYTVLFLAKKHDELIALQSLSVKNCAIHVLNGCMTTCKFFLAFQFVQLKLLTFVVTFIYAVCAICSYDKQANLLLIGKQWIDKEVYIFEIGPTSNKCEQPDDDACL